MEGIGEEGKRQRRRPRQEGITSARRNMNPKATEGTQTITDGTCNTNQLEDFLLKKLNTRDLKDKSH